MILFTIKEDTQEFVAKYFCDMSKAILTVGMASYFFKDMHWLWRLGLFILSIAFLFFSVILMERKAGKSCSH